MRIQISLKNEFGEFRGDIMDLTEDQHRKIIELSKTFYETGFEMDSEDGGFIIFPPEIVKRSILKVNILKENSNENTQIS